MQKILIVFLFLISNFYLSSCTSSLWLTKYDQKVNKLNEQINFLISDPSLHNAHIGIYIEALKDGRVLYARNPFKLMIPASNMKLFTTAAALIKLGPAFKFTTQITYTGSIKDSILYGNLLIKGSGDPSISGRFYGGDRLAVFKQWADSLKSRGIREIKGQIIGDARLFKAPKLAEGWNWDDESFWYAAKISALAYNDNCVDLAIFPDSLAGKTVQVRLFPEYSKVKIINKAITVDRPGQAELKISRLQGKNTIVIEGAMSVNADTVRESITVENVDQFFLDILAQTFEQQGIELSSGVRLLNEEETFPEDSLKMLFSFHSPPLSEIIKVINKRSHNFYTEQLLKTMGAVFKGEGSFEAGAAVVREFLNSIGVADEHFINVDGSGLSRKNFVAPIATATLLRYMYYHPDFQYYLNSLPAAGIDGTISDRMIGTRAQGKVHAKTGYVGHVRALSGYVNPEGKNPLLFVLMFNNYSVPTPKINLIQDKIAILLTEFSMTP
ncbi:D-alanyl-D-alaninecarboxypeptidase/D-alanyl-D-al anine-endopeptidase [Caldithrix abyssi DSM 13497]|uniref:D-alanyl-D-alanine carboxypeptidase / D-alanyl-D-alanine-endopeptidase (Penicillin-binding protein 4) n=1 Tax=Caldithrix abyssi DSM 13497 TaxID=880073 RepID=H1XV33_CALAY|nr:D-alanyl-D-alanine carboxypeptidase/D-alanyl-D-alanine-endopeptidase [Caldithrix abyssi]APF18905.1 D-alanyl-D-alanine carboxypeptidase / D-alanyl-D-alanine-endopeptidase (penicillin-binding protein 4) [Caldithrix abyssi DSM 13497]EHO42866.1 D-alanyl-D-alaninecarboxypeptidase/D-alanyl-D-al anine-endopeptidase [Caldithrix abyssi DSM 13497]